MFWQSSKEIIISGVLLAIMLQPLSAQTHVSHPRRNRSFHTSSARKSSLAARAIHYVGGRKPHIVVIASELSPYFWQDSFPNGYEGKVRRQTPYGAVLIYWRVDQGTEDGSVIPHPDEIHQYSTITHFAVISPRELPVIAYIDKPNDEGQAWLHINGMRMAYYPPGGTDRHRPGFRLVKLRGGLNIIQAGLHDVE